MLSIRSHGQAVCHAGITNNFGIIVSAFPYYDTLYKYLVGNSFPPTTPVFCSESSYWFIGYNGSTTSGFKTIIKKRPVNDVYNIVKFHVAWGNDSETLRFYINGSWYPITPANLGTYSTSCTFTSTVASGGDLLVQSGASCGTDKLNAEVTINSFKYQRGNLFMDRFWRIYFNFTERGA